MLQRESVFISPPAPNQLWRASLLALDCEAVPKPATSICQTCRISLFYDDFVAKREQAPSPQKLSTQKLTAKKIAAFGCDFFICCDSQFKLSACAATRYQSNNRHRTN